MELRLRACSGLRGDVGLSKTPLDQENQKELDELIRLVSRPRPKVSTGDVDQKDAHTLLEYITYLEKSVEYYKTQVKEIPKEWMDDVSDYDEKALNQTLTKLVGIAAGLRTKHKDESGSANK